MPTYAYTCTECGHSFDIHQSFSDDALTECPNCGGKLRKLFSSVGVVFKGSGFYRTDSRSGSTSSTPAASTGGSGSTGGGSGSSGGSSSGGSSSGSSTGGSSAAGSSSGGTSSGGSSASSANSAPAAS